MIYLDNSATTRPFDSAIEAMAACMRETYFNPSSLYAPAMRAGEILAEARREILSAVGGRGQVFFTSGGTEADNLAILGAQRALRGRSGNFLTTKVEHPAVLETMAEVERLGCRVTYADVDAQGVVDVDALVAAVDGETALVSVMQVNNEVGARMPIAEIARRVKEKNPRTLVHVDGVQGFLRVPIHMAREGVDLYTLSGHKIHGPKGIGALVVAPGVHLMPTVFGGGQEGGLRSGTENVPGAVGMAAALQESCDRMAATGERLTAMRDRLIAGILRDIPRCRLNGDSVRRLPGNVNISFEGIEGESLLLMLDMKGICASSGSACTSGSLDPSHVLLSIGLKHAVAHGSLRLTFSEETTEADIDYILSTVPAIVARLREMSPLWEDIMKGTVS